MQGNNLEPFTLRICDLNLDIPNSVPGLTIDRLCTLQVGEENDSNCVYCAGGATDDERCLNNVEGLPLATLVATRRYRLIVDTELSV